MQMLPHGDEIEMAVAHAELRWDELEPLPEGSSVSLVACRYPVVLASASPRRQVLIRRIVDDFDVLPSTIDEEGMATPVPWETARIIARAKAQQVARLRPDALVIGGDTIVAIPIKGGYDQLFKPADATDAKAMLRRLSGIEHLVVTGICLIWPGGSKSFEVTTGVRFRHLTEDEIADYVASGEPMDKAGAYGAQGKGAGFIAAIRGSLSNVVGLPVDELRAELREITG